VRRPRGLSGGLLKWRLLRKSGRGATGPTLATSRKIRAHPLIDRKTWGLLSRIKLREEGEAVGEAAEEEIAPEMLLRESRSPP
jgi:hypothetical protein